MSSGKGRGVERIAVCEANPLGNLTFPIDLPADGTVELCQVNTAIRRGCDKFLIFATVNWQVVFNFTGVARFTTPGFAQITFRILRNGSTVYEVIETATQPGAGVETAVTGPVVVPVTTGLLHFENISNISNIFNNDCDCSTVFSLQATDIILTPPVAVDSPAITTTAAAQAVTLVVNQLR